MSIVTARTAGGKLDVTRAIKINVLGSENTSHAALVTVARGCKSRKIIQQH